MVTVKTRQGGHYQFNMASLHQEKTLVGKYHGDGVPHDKQLNMGKLGKVLVRDISTMTYEPRACETKIVQEPVVEENISSTFGMDDGEGTTFGEGNDPAWYCCMCEEVEVEEEGDVCEDCEEIDD